MSGSSGSAAEPGPDAVEQVQRALLTLIGAARVMLDAVENLVADRSRIDNLAKSGRDLVNTVVATVFPPEPSGDDSGKAERPHEPAS